MILYIDGCPRPESRTRRLAAAVLSREISRVKTVYDCCSCALGLILSFAFFGWGQFVGVKAGTIFCALVNGWLIGRCGRWLEGHFAFRDGMKLRKYFEI